MSSLSIPRHEIRRIYVELADDVAGRERRLGDELPIDTTADVPGHLREAVRNWKSGRKSLRTVPVCNVYARECLEEVPEDIVGAMVGLDGVINMLDDIIDTRNLPTEEKVGLTLNVAFSIALLVEGTPPEARDEVTDILLEYLTAVFQIPLVERRLFDRLSAAETASERQAAAEAVYAYRSRDIDAFARLPASVMDVSEETATRLVSDLRTYRARRLLFKDIRDVERDLADGDSTPIIHLLRTCEEGAGVVAAVEDLHERFQYSTAGASTYGDVLEELEEPPSDLGAAIEHTREMTVETVV